MKKVKKFFADFKKFIAQGNVLNLAVGVIIGAAFGKIVSSLVADIIMPLVTGAVGAASLAELSFTLRPEIIQDGEIIREALKLHWGNFLQNVIDFIIIAFVVFIFVKVLNTAKSTTLKLAANSKELFENNNDDKEIKDEEQKQENTEKDIAILEDNKVDKDCIDTADNLATLKNIESLLVEIKSALKGDNS